MSSGENRRRDLPGNAEETDVSQPYSCVRVRIKRDLGWKVEEINVDQQIAELRI